MFVIGFLALFTIGGLTGVVLSNASLDVAFHDTDGIKILNVATMMKPIIKNKNDNINDDYVKMFWVGLMDGDGSIQVNHWRKQSLQYRFVIKLSNIKSNYNMLIKIAKVIGGSVRITGKAKDVIWVVNKKETVQKTIEIFDAYPPLTSKKICQLEFLKKCLHNNSVDYYLSNRNSKYLNQQTILKSYSFGIESNSSTPSIPPLYPFGPEGEGAVFEGGLVLPNYFKGWLSGFIEAEGCFSIRNKDNHSFSIGQNDDFYLINAIKQYLGATNQVRNPYKQFYSLEVYKKETLRKIINHLYDYPLLGEKAESLKKFNHKII